MDLLNEGLTFIVGWISFANDFIKNWWGILFVAIFIWVLGELNWIRELIRRTSIGQRDINSEVSQIKIELISLRKRVAPTDNETLKKFSLFD